MAAMPRRLSSPANLLSPAWLILPLAALEDSARGASAPGEATA